MLMRFALVLLLASTADAFPISSSSSSKKSKARPKTSGGSGFGSKAPVVLQHERDETAGIQNLLQFLVAKQGAVGLDTGDLEAGISKETGVRGLFCTRAYNKGELLCQIPSDAALCLMDPAAKEEISMAQAGCNFLEMYADQADAKVAWKPYLDTLPTLETHFDATPDFFDDEELELLEFPRIITNAKKRKQEIVTLASEKPELSLEQLQFATWIVSSRCFQITMTEGDSTIDGEGGPVMKKNTRVLRVLVPFLDLANHSSDAPNAELHLIDPDKDDAWFALKATRNIGVGKEIVINYGTGIESSVELLSNYGFVPFENKVDKLMLNKGGDDTLTKEAWTTTLEEDQAMLQEADGRLKTILEFRARLKQAYAK